MVILQKKYRFSNQIRLEQNHIIRGANPPVFAGRFPCFSKISRSPVLSPKSPGWKELQNKKKCIKIGWLELKIWNFTCMAAFQHILQAASLHYLKVLLNFFNFMGFNVVFHLLDDLATGEMGERTRASCWMILVYNQCGKINSPPCPIT